MVLKLEITTYYLPASRRRKPVESKPGSPTQSSSSILSEYRIIRTPGSNRKSTRAPQTPKLDNLDSPKPTNSQRSRPCPATAASAQGFGRAFPATTPRLGFHSLGTPDKAERRHICDRPWQTPLSVRLKAEDRRRLWIRAWGSSRPAGSAKSQQLDLYLHLS